MKFIPMLFNVVGGMRRLRGATASRTTGKQASYVTIAILVVVVLGQLVGQSLPEDMQASLVEVLVWVIGIIASLPFWSRIAGYREPAVPNPSGLIAITHARHADSDMWFACPGTDMDAVEEGYQFGRDCDGVEWDLTTGQKTGKVLRFPRRAADSTVSGAKEHLQELSRTGSRWDDGRK